MRTSILLISFLSLIFTLAQAQKIEFQKTEHNFGVLNQGDPAVHTFSFENVSEQPITLTNVKASCGCTVPSWEKGEVAPGETSEIEVKYNSNRIGKFTKSITVTYDEEELPIRLYIKGDVKQDPDQQAKMEYPVKMGGLAFNRTQENIGLLESDKDKTLTFKVRNNSEKAITFTGRYEKEIMFDVKPKQFRLEPNKATEIEVVVKGNVFIDEGAFSKKIGLETDDLTQPMKTITITGRIKRVISEEELAKAPNIEFEQTEYKGGTVIEGEKVTYAFKFKNTGQSNLNIENVKASCGCTATAPKDKVVAAGANSEIIAEFNSARRSGLQRKSITVKTNDPDQPTIMLRFEVEVVQDPFHANDLGPSAAPTN